MEVVVSKAKHDLVALDAKGVVIFYAPVSSGSTHDPLPIGDWTVKGVYLNPRFFYNPDLFWDADSTQAKTRIALECVGVDEFLRKRSRVNRDYLPMRFVFRHAFLVLVDRGDRKHAESAA